MSKRWPARVVGKRKNTLVRERWVHRVRADFGNVPRGNRKSCRGRRWNKEITREARKELEQRNGFRVLFVAQADVIKRIYIRACFKRIYRERVPLFGAHLVFSWSAWMRAEIREYTRVYMRSCLRLITHRGTSYARRLRHVGLRNRGKSTGPCSILFIKYILTLENRAEDNFWADRKKRN